MIRMIKNLYSYREFLKTSVLKEFRGKYKKSFLGVIWSFINPLLQLLIYSLVFSFIMRSNVEHYTVFLVVALIPWTFFSTTINQGVGCIVQNEGIIKKVYFPREILPVSVVTSNLLNFCISCLIILGALLISGIGISWHIVFLPIVVLIQYIFTLGIVLFVSSITVYIRDLEYFINVLIMLWFYLNPIVYSVDIIPDKYLPIFNLNPMLHILNGYRDVLYYQHVPNLVNLLILAMASLVIFIVGYRAFKKFEKRFAEEL